MQGNSSSRSRATCQARNGFCAAANGIVATARRAGARRRGPSAAAARGPASLRCHLRSGHRQCPCRGRKLAGSFGAGSPQRRPWTSPTGPCSAPGSWGHFHGEKPTAPRTAFFLARARWSRVQRRGCCAEEAGAARHPPAPATGRSLEGGGGPGALKPCPKASRPLPSVAGTKPPPGFPVGGNAHSPAFLPSPKFSRAGGRYQARASAAGVGKAKRRRVNTDDLLLLGN